MKPTEVKSSQQDKQFRGTFNHPLMHELLEAGKITGTEFALVAVIESYSKGKDGGCWASKATLGKTVGVKNLSHVFSMLDKLKRLGIIIEAGEVKVEGRIRKMYVTAWTAVNILPSMVKHIGPTWLTIPNVLSSFHSDNTLSCIADAIAGPTEENKMPLVEISPSSPNNNSTTESHINQAKVLKSSLTKKHVGTTTKFSAKSWAKEFALLEAAVGAHRVVPVLTWYCQHIRDQYVPLAFSAKAFRTKFDQIEAAMLRHERDNPSINISKEASKLAEELASLKWPKGGGQKELAVAIQQTMDTYKQFLAKVNALSKLPVKEPIPGKKNQYRLIKGRECAGAAGPVLERLQFPAAFARMWFVKLHGVAAYFGKDWNGSVSKGALTDITNRRFLDYVEGILGSYTHEVSIESFMRALDNVG